MEIYHLLYLYYYLASWRVFVVTEQCCGAAAVQQTAFQRRLYCPRLAITIYGHKIRLYRIVVGSTGGGKVLSYFSVNMWTTKAAEPGNICTWVASCSIEEARGRNGSGARK